MNIYTNLGFDISEDHEVPALIDKAFSLSRSYECAEGIYSVYTDPSAAQLYIQRNHKQDCIGMNPYFKGSSRRPVKITSAIRRVEGELDGAYRCWASPDNTGRGLYPFDFDVPDFRLIPTVHFPFLCEIQLLGSAHEISYYENEQAFYQSQSGENPFAIKSFIPVGLFAQGASAPEESLALISGIIKSSQFKTNQLMGGKFFAFLVDTLGGEIDIVADPRFFSRAPQPGGIIHGRFWISGRLIA